MHDRLAEILEQEVIGEVTCVGNAFFDVGLGRVCLDALEPGHIEQLLARVQRAFPGNVQISDQLHLADRDQLIRGLVVATIHHGGTPYLLHITAPPIVAYYEQRFMLEAGVMGDLMGTLCDGIGLLVAQGEDPLRVLSGYEDLVAEHREHLDAVVTAAAAGERPDPRWRVEELVEPLRRAWRLVPWHIREGLRPTSRVSGDRITPHDPVLLRTILLAVDLVEGLVKYQYVHQHNPLEEYEQVLSWMTEIHGAMVDTYPSPRFAAAMARASSAEVFVRHFPGFRRIVGTVPDDTDGTEAA